MLRVFAIAFLIGLSGQAKADAATEAEAAATQMIEAADALEQAGRARDRVAALTEAIQAYEAGLAALRKGLRAAALRERSLREEFSREEVELNRLTGALLSMQTSPEALLLLHPSGPVDTARAAMLLAEVTPALQSRVEALSGQLEELAILQSLDARVLETLQVGLTSVQAARLELSQAIAARRVSPDPTDQATILALIESAETLDAFASGLGDSASAVADDAFRAAKGALRLPVRGTPILGYNDADAAGIRRPGLVLASNSGAAVTAPWPSTVRYAGPLLDYGNVIILEPETGYLLVLAGLGEVFGTIGDVVTEGSVVGLMAGAEPQAEDLLLDLKSAGGQNRTETLYVELRVAGEPEDPARWFETGKE